MTKGKKLPTPLGEKERSKYKTRRAKNNESAARHRERNKQLIKEGERDKKALAELLAEQALKDNKMAEMEHENTLLLEFLLTHECVSSKAHREQLYCTFYRSHSVVRSNLSDLRRHQSSPSRNETIDGCYVEPFDPPCTPLMQNQMMTRPTDFDLDNFQPWKAATSTGFSSQNDHQQHGFDECTQRSAHRCNNFQEFMDTKTGYTPAAAQTLGDVTNFHPWDPTTVPSATVPASHYPTQTRLNPDQHTPMGQYFIANYQQNSDSLSVLSEEDVSENLLYLQL